VRHGDLGVQPLPLLVPAAKLGPRAHRRDEGDVDFLRRRDVAERYRRAVREYEERARADLWPNRPAEERALFFVGEEERDDVRAPDRGGRFGYAEAVRGGLLAAGAFTAQADGYCQPGVAEVEGLRPALGAETDNRDGGAG
jgi:hypothetical protein